MSKALKIAAIVVGVAAVVVTAGAALSLLPAALTIGGLTVSTAALGTILSVGAAVLSLAAGVLAKPPKLQSTGQQLEWTADPAAGEPYCVGDCMVGASIVHQASWGDKNRYLGIVGVLSVCTIAGYDGLFADMTQVVFSGRNATGYYASYMYQSTQLGAMPESAALNMTAPDASTMPNWGSTYKTSGLATVGLVLVADIANGKVYSGGTPQLTNRIRGVLAYDPRLDSSQSGGSGSQRALNESTYAYSENPFVHALTYAMGRWQNGVKVIGPGLAPAQIDVPAFVEAANIADFNGWKISGQVYSTDDKWTVLKSMCQAGGGYPMPSGALLSCLVNAPRVSLATINESDVKGPVSAPQMLTRRSRYNGAIPRARLADQGWQIAALTAVRNSTYLTQDGGIPSTQEIEFALVADKGDGHGKNQAAQLAAYEVANSRERNPISVDLGYAWSQYKLGDCLTLNLPSANLVNQKCLVIGRSVNPAKNTVTLVFRTEDDAKHSWALGTGGSTSIPPAISQPHGIGDNGSISLSNASVFLYQRAASAPTVPSVTTTYTFATGGLAGENNGWTQAIPAVNGQPLWVTVAAATNSGPTDTIGAGEWSSPVILVQDGTGSSGSNGDSVAVVYLYQRAASTPAAPSTTSTFTFATGVLTGYNNGWSQGVPAANGNPLYVTVATASSSTATDTIAAGEWAAPVVMAQDGSNGSNGSNGIQAATVFLYKRAASTPAVPSATTTYNFTSGALSGITNGWSQSVPSTNGNPCYVTTATALVAAPGTTDTIGSSEWASPAILAQDGTNGTNGSNGADGSSIASTPDSITVPCTPNGTPKIAIPGFQMIAFQGSTNITSSATYTFTSSGLTGVTNAGGGAFTVSSMTADTGYVEVTVNGGLKKRITYTKAYDGGAYDQGQEQGSPTGTYGGAFGVAVLAGPNGNFQVSWSYDAIVTGGTSGGVSGYVQYSLNGSTWTTLSGSSASDGPFPPGEGVGPYSNVTFTGASIGLSSKQTVYFRLMITPSGSLTSQSGNLYAQWTG